MTFITKTFLDATGATFPVQFFVDPTTGNPMPASQQVANGAPVNPATATLQAALNSDGGSLVHMTNIAKGLGSMQSLPAASTNGTLLGIIPAGALGARFYLKNTDSVTLTIQNTQPTVPPGQISGGQNPLTMANSTYDTSGEKFGTGALASGNSGTCSTSAVVAAIQGAAWTLEGWFKIAAAPSTTQIIAGGIGTTPFYIEMTTAGTVTYQVWAGSLAGSSATGKADGNWHHFAIVVISATSSQLYVDGVMTASSSNTVASGAWTGIGIGSFGWNAQHTYDWAGEVDEVALWNVAKYTANFTPPTVPYASGLATNVALYHLDSSGLDSSSNATAGAPTFTISGASTGPNWDENFSGGVNAYITATVGTPTFRWI